MRSKTDFAIELEAQNIQKGFLTNLGLYEEYRQRNVAQTINTQRESFVKGSFEDRRLLEEKVENEIRGFCIWLEETKDFDRDFARYYSLSIKSLLLGISIGEHIAQLFDLILKRQKLDK